MNDISRIPVTHNADSLLIVDDSVVQRQHAVALSRALGVGLIYEAGNGLEALELLAMLVLPPTVIVVDLEMPGMDGIEFLQQLHNRNLGASVIVVSGREQALIESVETMGRMLGINMLAGLQKPLTAAALGSALAQRTAWHDAVAGGGSDVIQVNHDELSQAIGNHQISVHYQPKVDVRTGFVRGVEALARWEHPQHGRIPPGLFIAVAEREGLIHPLTMSVMGQALRQAAKWNASGLRLSVAINLSARLLELPDLVRRIVGQIEAHALSPEQVVLEITESWVVGSLGTALGMLGRLRLLGCGLSIDDYGTGFSSMQQLARIPFTELKVDRSFIIGASRKRNLRVILQSALDMAQRLGLVSVAEGVETEEDWRLLKECGCAVAQGYMIGRPMPAGDMPKWMKEHHQRLPKLRAGGHRTILF
ncbi:MAG: EAL domain-containing response regulator [Burkholderiales bacterium]|nr:EAL domain-containing response regulator [Burkholderiales bacterium]